MLFNPGDIVICIDSDWRYVDGEMNGAAPKKGGSYLVLEVVDFLYLGDPKEYLILGGLSSLDCWETSHFVKQDDPPEERKREKSKDLEKC